MARRSRDTAFERTGVKLNPEAFHPRESGVALRFPPQSMMRHDLPCFIYDFESRPLNVADEFEVSADW